MNKPLFQVAAVACAFGMAALPLVAQAAYYMNLKEKPSSVILFTSGITGSCKEYPSNIYCSGTGGSAIIKFGDGTRCDVSMIDRFGWDVSVSTNQGPRRCSARFINGNTADLELLKK